MKKTRKPFLYIVLILITTANLIPIFIVLFTSLKSDAEMVTGHLTLLPQEWHLDNYINAMTATAWGKYFKNSLIVTLVATFGSLFFNTLAGYTFARIRFAAKELLFICLLVGLMVPQQAIIVPQFIIMKSIPFFGHNDLFGNGGTGWLNTYYALIVPALSGSIGIFMARQFYSTFPKELDEAGYMDGNGYFGMYMRIFLPLSGPLLASLGILKIVSVWNDFFGPLIYTNTESMRTIQLGLQVFQGEYTVKYNELMAATIVVSIPMILAFVLFQKHFVASLISTSVKG